MRELCGGRSWLSGPQVGRLRTEYRVYTTVRRFQVRGTPAAVGRRLEQGVVPLVTRAPGFRSYAVLDAGAGVLLTITVFMDRTAAEEVERLAAAWVAENLGRLLVPEDTACGDVLVYAGL